MPAIPAKRPTRQPRQEREAPAFDFLSHVNSTPWGGSSGFGGTPDMSFNPFGSGSKKKGRKQNIGFDYEQHLRSLPW